MWITNLKFACGMRIKPVNRESTAPTSHPPRVAFACILYYGVSKMKFIGITLHTAQYNSNFAFILYNYNFAFYPFE